MSLLGPSWLTLAGSVLLSAVLFGLGGFVKGTEYEKAKATIALLKATQAARDTEENWQINLEAQNELDIEERARMAADYDRGLSRLRNRAPVRMPAIAASACVGTSPAQLAAPDAERFERIGRDARAVQLDLEKARAWIETVTHH